MLPSKLHSLSLLTISLVFLSACSNNVEKLQLTLHVFECGKIEVRDESLFSPGVNKGKTKQMVDSCYLIQPKKAA